MADLTDLTAIKLYLGITGTAQDTKLQAILTAASRAVELYLDRHVLSAARTEYYDGGGKSYLSLRGYPVTDISRLASTPCLALSIANTDTTTNQRASAKLSSTSLVLSTVASGVSSADTLSLSNYATIQLLADEINSLGSGWSATVVSDYQKWTPGDLRAEVAAKACGGGNVAEFTVFGDERSDYGVDTDTGTLYADWPSGFLNVAITYTSGYATVPEDLQMGVVALVAALYRLSSREQGGVKREKLGDYEYENFPTTNANAISVNLPALSADAELYLAPYRRIYAL